MRRLLIALAAASVVAAGGIAYAVNDDGEPTASCTPSPAVADNGTTQRITVTCDVPKPPAVTETVDVPGPTSTATVTETATETATATATATVTQTATTTATATATAPGPTTTVTAPGPTSTVTVTASPSTGPSSAPPATSTPTTSSPTPTATTTPPSNGTFPDASNTGVPAGTTLTAYTGPSNITTPNTVISGKTIGCIQVSAPGVVIRNSRLSCSNPGTYVVDVDDKGGPSSAPLLLEDVEITCQGGAGTAIGEAWVTVVRANIWGCENGFDVNQGITVTDSYIHALTIGGHEDGIQLAQYWTGTTYATGARNVTIRHNTIFGTGPDGTLGTSAIISNRGSGDLNITIDRNLLGGGAYTLYCPGGKGTNIRVTDNHFTKRFSSRYGAYGPSDSCSDEATVTGNVVSGNVDHETGLPLNLS